MSEGNSWCFFFKKKMKEKASLTGISCRFFLLLISFSSLSLFPSFLIEGLRNEKLSVKNSSYFFSTELLSYAAGISSLFHKSFFSWLWLWPHSSWFHFIASVKQKTMDAQTTFQQREVKKFSREDALSSQNTQSSLIFMSTLLYIILRDKIVFPIDNSLL